LYIKEIQLKNFRNYDSLKLDVVPGINVIYGKNGYGKTNILEAMFLCCIGKSFRTNHDIEMIKKEEYKFSVRVALDENLFGVVDISYDKKKNKVIKVDGICIDKIKMLMGKMNGIIFSPETISMINEGPSERRRFLDVALCQMSGSYYYALSMYNHFANQKIALLLNKNNIDETTLQIYNENLAKYGGEIIFKRYGFMQNVNSFAKEFYKEISEDTEKLEIKYLPCSSLVEKYFLTNEEKSLEEIQKLLFENINSENNRKKEIEYGKCLVGPHRDDFECKLDDVLVKAYGSQGQKRSVVVSIKLAEIEIMKKITGNTPILFLDDVLSELDRVRKNKILELTKNYQTFITCTDRDIAEDLLKISNNYINKVNYINVEILR